MRRWVAVLLIVVCAVTAWWATAASSDSPVVRDDNGRTYAPGQVVADLVRGADGKCRPRPGQELAVTGKAQPGERGSVSIRVDQATCKLVVEKVDAATASDPPTGQITDGGRR